MVQTVLRADRFGQQTDSSALCFLGFPQLKKTFIANLLFPTLQLIQAEYSALPTIQFIPQEDSEVKLSRRLRASDFSVFSLLSALEDEFSIVTELFSELMGE